MSRNLDEVQKKNAEKKKREAEERKKLNSGVIRSHGLRKDGGK